MTNKHSRNLDFKGLKTFLLKFKWLFKVLPQKLS